MISVTIDTQRFDNPIHLGLYVLRELRQAGVPVAGVLSPMWVEQGRLTVGEPDLCTGEVVWTWAES